MLERHGPTSRALVSALGRSRVRAKRRLLALVRGHRLEATPPSCARSIPSRVPEATTAYARSARSTATEAVPPRRPTGSPTACTTIQPESAQRNLSAATRTGAVRLVSRSTISSYESLQKGTIHYYGARLPGGVPDGLGTSATRCARSPMSCLRPAALDLPARRIGAVVRLRRRPALSVAIRAGATSSSSPSYFRRGDSGAGLGASHQTAAGPAGSRKLIQTPASGTRTLILSGRPLDATARWAPSGFGELGKRPTRLISRAND
jgi:hypothetical protein